MIKITDDEFSTLAVYIKEYSGINLKNEKKTLLVGRLSNMLAELGMDNFRDYYNYLKSDENGSELNRLIDKITTNHTYFMREAEHFSYFSQVILPFMENNIKNHDLRVWCAASSSGEEPYTLAMILEDYFKTKPDRWDKRMLATDLSLEALNQAKLGIYSLDKISNLPKAWKLCYFDKIHGNNYQVKSQLRDEIIFRRFNLIEPIFPFKKKFHVVFCRNVMIYFDNNTKDELLEKIYDHIEYGGYLFIGYSEYINRSNTKFKYIQPSVYRKI